MKDRIIKKVVIYFGQVVMIVAVMGFLSCSEDGDDTDPGGGDDPTIQELRTGYLVDKTGNWSVVSVNVPTGSATTSDEWGAFTVVVTSSNMTTSRHPTGSEAVWPSGGWTLSEDGNTITRGADGVEMSVTKLTGTECQVSFTVPDGVITNGRVMVLSGEYTFNLK